MTFAYSLFICLYSIYLHGRLFRKPLEILWYNRISVHDNFATHHHPWFFNQARNFLSPGLLHVVTLVNKSSEHKSRNKFLRL